MSRLEELAYWLSFAEKYAQVKMMFLTTQEDGIYLEEQIAEAIKFLQEEYEPLMAEYKSLQENISI